MRMDTGKHFCIEMFALFSQRISCTEIGYGPHLRHITGTRDPKAIRDSTIIDVQENWSEGDVIIFRVLPACTASTDGGATPIKVPNQNAVIGTPICGETMLISQFGRIGVTRRNIIK